MFMIRYRDLIVFVFCYLEGKPNFVWVNTLNIIILYLNCRERYEDKIGHHSYTHNFEAVVKLKPEKNQAWTGFKPMTSAILVPCTGIAEFIGLNPIQARILQALSHWLPKTHVLDRLEVFRLDMDQISTNLLSTYLQHDSIAVYNIFPQASISQTLFKEGDTL